MSVLKSLHVLCICMVCLLYFSISSVVENALSHSESSFQKWNKKKSQIIWGLYWGVIPLVHEMCKGVYQPPFNSLDSVWFSSISEHNLCAWLVGFVFLKCKNYRKTVIMYITSMYLRSIRLWSCKIIHFLLLNLKNICNYSYQVCSMWFNIFLYIIEIENISWSGKEDERDCYCLCACSHIHY